MSRAMHPALEGSPASGPADPSRRRASAREWGRRTGVPESHIVSAIRSGQLEGFEENGEWYVAIPNHGLVGSAPGAPGGVLADGLGALGAVAGLVAPLVLIFWGAVVAPGWWVSEVVSVLPAILLGSVLLHWQLGRLVGERFDHGQDLLPGSDHERRPRRFLAKWVVPTTFLLSVLLPVAFLVLYHWLARGPI